MFQSSPLTNNLKRSGNLSASDHLFLDLLAESSMNLRKLIDLDRELASNFSEFHGWALNDHAFGFDDLG